MLRHFDSLPTCVHWSLLTALFLSYVSCQSSTHLSFISHGISSRWELVKVCFYNSKFCFPGNAQKQNDASSAEERKGNNVFSSSTGVYFYSYSVYYLCLLSSLFVCITPTDINGRSAHVRKEDNQTLNVFLLWQLNPWIQEVLHFMSTCSNIFDCLMILHFILKTSIYLSSSHNVQTDLLHTSDNRLYTAEIYKNWCRVQ